MRTLFAFAALALLSAPAVAQLQSEYALYGAVPDYQVRRTVDLDLNGDYLGAGEGWDFASDNRGLVDFLSDMRYEFYQNTTHSLFTIGNGDTILQMVDLDGDGVCKSAGEVNVFWDMVPYLGTTNQSPDALDFDPATGELYVADDIFGTPPAGTPGIHRIADLDNSGSIDQANEHALFVDGLTPVTVPATGGPVTIDVGDFEAIMVNSDGDVIAFNLQDRAIYLFKDLNGDDDAMDAGEALNFFNPIGTKPGLDQNADVVSNLLPNPSCPSTSGLPLFGSLKALSVEHGAGPGGRDVYWIGSSANSSSCIQGAGYVFRGVDLNDDDDINDAGEVTLWVDGANNPFMIWNVTAIWDGMHDDADGSFNIFNGNGPPGPGFPQDTVYKFVDLNNDNDAEDSGEQILLYQWDPDGCFAVSLAVLPQGSFWRPPVGSCTPFGVGGMNSQNQVPDIGSNGIPMINSSFDATLQNALPNQRAILLVGFSNTKWKRGGTTFNLPLDLTFAGMPGNTLYTSVEQQFITNSNGGGAAVLSINIPNDPGLSGRTFYMQWYCRDQIQNPRGWVMSNAAECVIQ